MAGSTVSTGGVLPRSVAAVSLWRAKWIILAVIVVAFVGGYQYSKDQPATYTAQSRIVLSAAQPFDPLGTYSGNDPNRYVADQVAIIRTQAILGTAAQQLAAAQPVPYPIDPVELRGQITPEPSATASEIIVNAKATNAGEAVARANAVAAAYESYLAGQVRAVVDASVAAFTDPDLIEEVRAKAAAYGDGVQFVETAAPGSASSSLAPMRSALLITAVAALVVIGLALLWRTPPPDGSQVVNAARTRVLGTVPARRVRRGATVRPQEHALALVALDYARRDAPGPVLLTGSSAGSGAPAVAYGLAVSAAAQGRRVLLVDGDPDRRELVRVGRSTPGRSIEEFDHAGVAREDVVVPAGAEGLFVATAGENRSALLDGAAVGRALTALGADFDLVLVQSGPVSTSPVGLALVEHVSAVVLVARRRDSGRSIPDLLDRLDAAGRPLVGLVLTGRRRGLPWLPAAARPEQPQAPTEAAAESSTSPSTDVEPPAERVTAATSPLPANGARARTGRTGEVGAAQGGATPNGSSPATPTASDRPGWTDRKTSTPAQEPDPEVGAPTH